MRVAASFSARGGGAITLTPAHTHTNPPDPFCVPLAPRIPQRQLLKFTPVFSPDQLMDMETSMLKVCVCVDAARPVPITLA